MVFIGSIFFLKYSNNEVMIMYKHLCIFQLRHGTKWSNVNLQDVKRHQTPWTNNSCPFRTPLMAYKWTNPSRVTKTERVYRVYCNPLVVSVATAILLCLHRQKNAWHNHSLNVFAAECDSIPLRTCYVKITCWDDSGARHKFSLWI